LSDSGQNADGNGSCDARSEACFVIAAGCDHRAATWAITMVNSMSNALAAMASKETVGLEFAALLPAIPPDSVMIAHYSKEIRNAAVIKN